jgi:hypothetical protein
VALAMSAAYAQEKKKAAASNADRKATASSPQVDAVQTARTADALAKYGDARKDALALIVAAKMLREVGSQELKAPKTSTGTASKAADKPDARTPDALLQRARALAGDRKDLLALADDVAKAGGRGASGGPKSTRTVVNSQGTDQFRISFDAGQPAMVAISGDGDSRLDLFVYDENGNRICSQVGPGDDAACRWTPSWSGSFTIRVVNYGIANQYRIWTN